MSTQNVVQTTKKILFNINYDLNAGGVRQLEIDALKGLNSTVSGLSIAPSPIDGTQNKSDITLFLARKRLIHLIDSWNHILNSGLFLEAKYYNNHSSTIEYLDTFKYYIGTNFRNHLCEHLVKDWSTHINYYSPLDFKTESIFYRMVRFLVACTNNHNWFVSNNVSKSSLFGFNFTGLVDITSYININFNPTSAKFLATMEGFLGILKELISESNLVSKLGITLDSLTYLTPEGRTNILALDTYKSNYKALAKIDLSYLNDETKVLAQEWIASNSSKVSLLYPQFATLISRNITGPGAEAWSFRNVAIDTSCYNQSDLNPTLDPANKLYQTKYQVCTQLDMKKPLVFSTQFINWTNPNDIPYVMLYNGGTLVYIPDEIKDQTTLNTTGEQPDNQLNLSAYFWKIGTSNGLDPHFDNEDDIKLKLPSTIPLWSIDKMDFLDNLTIYLKLN